MTYTFILASYSWTCEEDLSDVPYFVLNGCQFSCTVLCGLVPVCGSAIVRRSSRSPQGFGVSLPIAWSHPTLAGIKLFTRYLHQNYPFFLNLLSRRPGQPCANLNWHLSAPLAPLCSGGLPRVLLSFPRVPGLLVSRFPSACGPFDPCEPKFCDLNGRRFFPWITRPS